MKNKVLKKTLAAALALTLVSGAMPTVIGENGLTKPAIVADAAEIGDIINVGEHLVYKNAFYASAKGGDVFIDEGDGGWDATEVKVYCYDSDNSMIAICRENNTRPDYELSDSELIWVNVPSGREFEVPIGVKIISGDGLDTPYQLELVYENEPMENYDTVKVGTKWMIGDIINTDAYFNVDIQCWYENSFFVSKTVQFLKGRLHQCVDSTVQGDEWNSISFDYIMRPVYLSEDEAGFCHGFYTDFAFKTTPESILGIEVTGGSGTKEDPFTIAPITDAAEVGDVIYFGSHLNGCYKNYDGTNISYYDDEGTDYATIVNICDADWENSKICINKYGNISNEELWISVPAERAYEYPIGIKIESGEGTPESPYQLKLVYEGEPIGGDYQEVTVGTKWMIGDLINTNAYFRVPVECVIDNPDGASAVTSYEYRTLQLYRKNLSAPDGISYVYDYGSNSFSYKRCYGYSIPNITLGCMPSDAKNYSGMIDLDWTHSIFFVGNAGSFKGLEVTGGNGTQEDPFTIEPIRELSLVDGNYKQTSFDEGTHYARFVFVKPKSELEGKSKAVFTATNKNGVTKKFETSTYYTGMTSNGEYFTPADENSVMFIVTVSANNTIDDREPLKGLTCTLDFE